jgi:hypothetical protein
MAFTVLAVIGAAVAVAIYTCVSGLQKNIATARKTGFAYLVVRKWHLHLLHAYSTVKHVSDRHALSSCVAHKHTVAAHLLHMGPVDQTAPSIAGGELAIVSQPVPPDP